MSGGDPQLDKSLGYKLPDPITKSASILDSGINMELIKADIKQHEERLQRYEYLENLYKGFHDILNSPDKESWKPDNRLVVNFPKYITDTFIGYAYGIPIKISHEDDKITEAIKNFNDSNEITDHDSEMVKLCCEFGHAFEYLYQNEDSETKITPMSPKNLFCVYDDSIRNSALFAVRYGNIKVDDKDVMSGEILTRETIYNFIKDNITEERPNPYGYIPVVEWRMNTERMGLYETVAGLTETYNRVLAEKANDVDAFADVYLAVLGAELDEEGVYKIRDNRIINIYGTDNAKDVLVSFLQKPTADGTQENLLNRLERLIFQVTMVADISDDSFGSATSGVALAYKLQAMNNLAKMFDRKIEKSLKKRYKIFCSLGTNVSDAEAYKSIELQFSRNVPKNLTEEADIVTKLSGLLSRESLFKLLSVIDDPQKEIERIEKEEGTSQDKVLQASFFNGQEPKEGE